MKKTRNQAGHDGKREEFTKAFSPFAHQWDEFAFTHWYLPVFGPYIISKIAGIPTWLRLDEKWLGVGEDKLHLLYAFTLMLATFAFRDWAKSIPHTFAAFLEKGLLTAKSGEDSGAAFWVFLKDYQNALKSRARFSLIAIFLLFVTLIVVLMTIGETDVASQIVPEALATGDWFAIVSLAFFYPITGLVWGYLAGAAAWIMGVTGWYLRRLSIEFEVKVQPNHPDRCGGLRFLGNFNFKMVLPILIGSVLLGIVGLAGDFLNASHELRLGSTLALFLVALPLTYVAFFTPIWGIHVEMQARKTQFEEELASRISKLEARTKQLLGQEKFDDAQKSLEKLKAISPDSENKFPVWPFDLAVLARFLTPQIISIISSLFGIENEDYINIMKYLVSLLPK